MTRSRRPLDLPRRRLLQALGLGVAAGPIFPLLNATGAEPTFPKRLLLIFEPDGAPAKDFNTVVDWKPQGSETDFTLSDIHKPLEAIRQKILVPWGLKLSAGGAGENHAFGMAGLWTGSTLQDPSGSANFDGGNGHRTGWGSAPSIDQVVAKEFGPNMPYQRAADDASPETLFRTVQLGIECQDPTSLNRMIYAGADQPLHPEVNPKSAFDRLFKGVMPAMPNATPVTDDSALKETTREKSVLDLVAADLKRLRGRIGSEDFAKVDAHLEALGALERRVGATGSGSTSGMLSCAVPKSPVGTAYDAKLKDMSDITVAAFSCDVTRVMSLQWSYAFSHIKHTWIGLGDHHGYSHDGTDRRTELTAIDNWYAKQLLYLLQQLDSVKEGNGTMLDNTLVVLGRELGSTAHRMERAPFIMAGGAGGGLKPGRWLDFDGQPHAKLLVSIGQLMGLEIDTFGDRDPGSGPLAGIG
jgi:Protein of unknown function (DUF1552)